MLHALFNHVKLLTSITLAVALFFFLPPAWSMLARVLTSWTAGVILFVAWIFVWMSRRSAEELYIKYKEEDATAIVILVTVIWAALLSLVAIVALLATGRQVTGFDRVIHVCLAALTVMSSCLLVPTMFTLHDADIFYSAADDSRPLLFPQTRQPVFWDFAYFSFTIAAACQTADVATVNTAVRKTVLAQTLIAFVFNASILGFAVNISAGLFSG
jgi:uncharacterized membrane protein